MTIGELLDATMPLGWILPVILALSTSRLVVRLRLMLMVKSLAPIVYRFLLRGT